MNKQTHCNSQSYVCMK